MCDCVRRQDDWRALSGILLQLAQREGLRRVAWCGMRVGGALRFGRWNLGLAGGEMRSSQ
jgi:hypothetical protein